MDTLTVDAFTGSAYARAKVRPPRPDPSHVPKGHTREHELTEGDDYWLMNGDINERDANGKQINKMATCACILVCL
jgi:hypothetical protein